MKKMLVILAVATSVAIATVPADAGRKTVVRRGPHGRTTVVVHRAHPIHRPLPAVVLRAPRLAPRIMGSIFLPPVVFRTAIVVRPAPGVLCWEDSDVIYRDEEWTDLTLTADSRGRRLFLEVASGKAQLEFAEVVFENGEVQVVDFDRATLKAGTYSLIDFRDGRHVDHVRLVARAKSDEARLVLMMEK
jgi:hypothetical protein